MAEGSIFDPVGTTALDESTGNQDYDISTDTGYAGDTIDDVDGFSLDIETLLNAALAGFATADLSDTIQLAGDPSDNELEFDTNSGTISDVKFVDQNGNALDGDSSGLQTLDQEDIVLYTYPGNDSLVFGFVQGTEPANGGASLSDWAGVEPVLFVYMDKTMSGDSVTSVQFYTGLFQPLYHDTTENLGIWDSMGDNIQVAATQNLSFEFKGAPAGSNAFMAFGDADPQTDDEVIVVTGEDITHTVNSGKGGGQTTLGTDSQNVEAQAGLYFTFVTGMDPNYTVPSLSSKEASDPNNIRFQDVFGADEVSVRFVKVSTGPTNTFSVEFTVYTTDAEPATDGSPNAFFDGLTDDGSEETVPTPDIIAITVNGTEYTTDTVGVVSGLGTDSVVVSGLLEGDVVTYTTDGDHNRVFIRNAQPEGNNLQFSIADFEILSAEAEKIGVGDLIPFYDDDPTGSGQNAEFTVHEDALGTGNGETTVPPQTASITNGDISGVVATTALDQPVSFYFDDTNLGELAQLYTGGEALVYTVVPGATDTDPDIFYAKLGDGTEILRVELDPDGGVEIHLSGNVDHTVFGDTDTKVLDLSAITFAADKDGDSVGFYDTVTDTSEEALVVVVEDDFPKIVQGTAPTAVETSDSDLPDDTANVSIVGYFTVSPGADGEGSRDYDLDLTVDDGTASNLTDTLSGDTILLKQTGSKTVEGYIVDGAVDVTVFTVSVNGSGLLTVVQKRAVYHDDDGDPVETGADAEVLTAGLINAVLTVVDGDPNESDSTSLSVDVSQLFRFADDGPDVETTGATVPDLTTDDTDLASGDDTDSTSFAALFDYEAGDVSDTGNDGYGGELWELVLTDVDGSTPIIYSGLYDVATGEAIVLSLNDGVGEDKDTITGTLETAGTEAIVITVDQDGEVTQTQKRAIQHPPGGGTNQSVGLDTSQVKVELQLTGYDGDLDSDSEKVDITGSFNFLDDEPTIDGSITGIGPIETDDAEIEDTASEDFSDDFTTPPDYGEDGAPDSGGLGYTLDLTVGGGSGMTDTLTGLPILLRENSLTEIEGYVDDSGTEHSVFTIDVNSGGTVTLTQKRAVYHSTAADETIDGGAKIELVGTITDRDDDTAEKKLDITALFEFTDDVPDVTTNAIAVPSLTTDDADVPNDTSTDDFSGFFSVDYGNDQQGPAPSLVYSLSLSTADGASTGLYDVLTDSEILLRNNGGTIEGYFGTTVVFSITVDNSAGNEGKVTLEQDRAIRHSGGVTATLALAAANILLTATATDGDTDTDAESVNITSAFAFTDDVPTITTDNLVGTGTETPQWGEWSVDGGNDALASITLSVDGYRVDGGSTQTSNITIEPSAVDTTAPYTYTVTIEDDLDQNPANGDETFSFDITFNLDGTYKVEVAEQFGSTITASTAEGSLTPGGPDPVQTLLIPIPDEPQPLQIVFFGVDPLASETAVEAIILPNAGELTEAQIEAAGFAAIGDENMNVSTSGIGVDNNNLDGDGLAGITAGDESFVANPFDMVTGAKVYIDNAVGGYNPSTEALYYTIYYEDGSTYQDLVDASDLSAEPKKQQSFIVGADADLGETGPLIDAIQLTMAEGTVKIPVIEFFVSREASVDPLYFDLTATATDGDGSTDSSSFQIAIETDDDPLDGADLAYTDFEFGGPDDDQVDHFNFDLTSDIETWTVTGFDAGTDLLWITGVAGFGDLTVNDLGTDTEIEVTVDSIDRTILIIGEDGLTIDDFMFVT